MSTLQATNLKNASSTSNNIVLDTAGNATVAGTMAMGSSFLRNRIINGDMRIDQRNAGASVTANASVFGVDRFTTSTALTSKATVQRSTTAPTGFVNSLLYTSTAATSMAAGDYYSILHNIEGFNAADLGFGSASAQSITLSFWVRCSLTGSFGGSVQNSAYTRSYPFSYTISSANTWEFKTVTIAGDTSGTWLTDNGVGIRIRWALGMGSTYSGTAGAWVGSDIESVTGAVNVLGTNGATFYLTGVQLEAGTVATPFERRQYGQELALCQRYYEISGTYNVFSGNTTSGVGYYHSARYSVTKRANPSVTATDVNNNGFAAGVPSIFAGSTDILQASKTSNATVNGGYFSYSWVASAEL